MTEVRVRAEPGDDSDLTAFAELYRQHVRALLGYAGRRLGNPTEAADVVAAVFLQALESAGRFDPAKGSPRAWLFGIAANLVADRRRRAVTEYRALRRVYGRRELAADDYAELEDRIDADRLSPGLGAALDALSEAESELFLLVGQHGLTPAEAAAVVGISHAAARMRLARARRKLRTAITPEDPR